MTYSQSQDGFGGPINDPDIIVVKSSLVDNPGYEPLRPLEPLIVEESSYPAPARQGSEWTYERLKNALEQFNHGFFEYADELSSQIKTNFMIRSKFMTCSKRVDDKEVLKRQGIQEKIDLQESLEELQSKYNAVEHALEKVEDVNEDNKEAIARLRAHRERCIESSASLNQNIESLREEAIELRRQISRARAKSGQ